MLDLELIPEKSVGNEQWEFILGMHFSQAVAIIRQEYENIKEAQVIYDDLDPLDTDLIIKLTLNGIRLVFDAAQQRLKIIDIMDLNKLKLRYCGDIFSGPEVIPTFERIDQTFGATYPGNFSGDKSFYILSFRGLKFFFPIDNIDQITVNAPFPIGSVVSRIYIHWKNGDEFLLPPIPPECLYGQPQLESVEIQREGKKTTALLITLLIEDSGSKLIDLPLKKLCKRLTFLNTCQDVQSALGCPCRIYYKDEDKMSIHRPDPPKAALQRSDYFLNYNTLGMDILLDASSHCIKKFILHTNYPGHYNFNLYQRCAFIMTLLADKSDSHQGKQIKINAFTKWETIAEHLNITSKPVVVNRTSTDPANPFGSTVCFGYQDIIFEIMANGHLASITLFSMDNFSNDALQVDQ